MSYMLTVAMAFIRGSILAALITKLPLPQMPSTDVIRIDKRLCTQIINRRAEIICVDFRVKSGAPVCPRFLPEKEIDSQRDKTLLRQLLRIKI